jgi:hypothetical protein
MILVIRFCYRRVSRRGLVVNIRFNTRRPTASCWCIVSLFGFAKYGTGFGGLGDAGDEEFENSIFTSSTMPGTGAEAIWATRMETKEIDTFIF